MPVEVSLSPFLTDEGLIVTVAVRDVTEQHLARELLAQKAADYARSNAELEQFAYVASHDLQEPLRMVASYCQLLQRRYQGKLDADADDFIGFAVDGARRMQALINDLLAYSRARRREQSFVATDCSQVLDDVIANLQASIEEHDAEITHDPLPTVRADRAHLLQVLQNLIGNAIKFRDHGPQIHVAAVQQEDEWLFSVRDNGIGIAPEYAERIFEIFKRLHGWGEYPGTGIGLAVCKKLVERHGGRIWVESTPGREASFISLCRLVEELTDEQWKERNARRNPAGRRQPGRCPLDAGSSARREGSQYAARGRRRRAGPGHAQTREGAITTRRGRT